MKIKFKKKSSDFYKELIEETNLILTETKIRKAKLLIQLKFAFYFLIFIILYFNLFNPYLTENRAFIYLNFIALGLFGILLAFNCSHDCVHNTFSKSRKLNNFIYYITFNLQGVNSRLWKIRHIASHHIFPNVDGCDADIDNNPFIRLSESHPKKEIHKYQHIYATILYCLYTLHWIFVKDFIYLSKKELANLKNQTYSTLFVIELIMLKIIYLIYILVIPYILTGIPFLTLLTRFLLMHFSISIFFVLTLIISHLTTETEFPKIDKGGFLPYDYYEHQLAVSLDYHPNSKFANWIFGGFNSHSAHHLFPKLPHTVYNTISPTIKSLAIKHKLPYNEMNIIDAIFSHYKYLKNLGK